MTWLTKQRTFLLCVQYFEVCQSSDVKTDKGAIWLRLRGMRHAGVMLYAEVQSVQKQRPASVAV